jgi:hypothetical protein
MWKGLANLFEGHPNKYLTTSLTGEVDERGKREAKCTTVHEPLTGNVWSDHIKGKLRIGVLPEKEDLVKWGCIDVDPRNYKDYSQKKYVDIIKDNKLPLVPVRSKSGGLHLFLFLKDWSDKKRVLKVLHTWNDKFFLSDEVFPMNKAVNMPYFNADATTEHGYDENNTPILIGRFIDYSNTKIISLEDLEKIKTQEYEPESRWSEYPPCVQSMINEKWSGNHRNDLLFNIGVMEIKKADGELTKKELLEILIDRNKQVFAKPLTVQEIKSTILNSLSKKNYTLKCMTPLCSKDKCKNRSLGIGTQPPDILEDFSEITFVQDTKSMHYTFKFQDKYITVTPEDMKDEKSWRVKLLKYKIFWRTLPKPKTGPSPFEMLLYELVQRAEEDTNLKFEDTMAEEKYRILKGFFEDHIEEDDYEKLKDDYVILDSKTNLCYFKKATLESYLNSRKRIFNTTTEAIRFLGCQRHDYYEGEQNVWYVKLPTFAEHRKEKPPVKVDNKPSELDDEFHTGKFKT